MSGLSPAQAHGVAAVLGTRSLEDAAKLAGVTTRTIRRWCSLPAFQAALVTSRRQTFMQALDELRVAASEAVGALRRIVTNPETPAGVVVQAAHAILTHAFRGVELQDVLERIQALEEASTNDATRLN